MTNAQRDIALSWLENLRGELNSKGAEIIDDLITHICVEE